MATASGFSTGLPSLSVTGSKTVLPLASVFSVNCCVGKAFSTILKRSSLGVRSSSENDSFSRTIFSMPRFCCASLVLTSCSTTELPPSICCLMSSMIEGIFIVVMIWLKNRCWKPQMRDLIRPLAVALLPAPVISSPSAASILFRTVCQARASSL